MGLIDQALGFHANALALRARRNEVLASNLANAETPGFQAKDLNFAETLRAMDSDSARGGERGAPRLQRTDPGHLEASGRRSGGDVKLLYRQPTQPSADGNTVEAHIEKAAFLENASGYEASLRFLDGRMQGIMTALRGDNA